MYGDIPGKVYTEKDILQPNTPYGKMKAEIEYYEKFLKQVNAKLSNEKFVNNAPEAVVALERKKQSDATTKLENLNNRIASLLNK